MHSVSPVHIRSQNQLKNPMTASNFEDLVEKKKRVQIGPSTIINEAKNKIRPTRRKNVSISNAKRKPAFQWTSPKKNKKCDLMKTCRLSDYTSPVKVEVKLPTCDVCVDSKTRLITRSRSPEKKTENNCAFLKRLSSSVSPVSLNRSLEFDPNATFTMPKRSSSHESYLNYKEIDALPIDENDLVLKKEILVKSLMNCESFSSDIMKVLELIREYLSSADNGLDLKTVLSYLKKDMSSLYQLFDLFHLTNRDLKRIICEFLNPSTLSMLRRVKENSGILKNIENLKLENNQLKQTVAEYEKNVSRTGNTNEALNIENNVLTNLKQSLEDNRAHLRRQLISREAECNRFSVQIRNLNRQLDRAKMEIELLRESREKAGLSKLKFSSQQNSTSTLNSKPLEKKSASTSNLAKSYKLDKTHFTFEEIINDPIKTRLYIEKLNTKLKEKDMCIRNLNEIIVQSKREFNEKQSSAPTEKTSSERSDKALISKLQKENEKLKLSLNVKEERLKNVFRQMEEKKVESKKPSYSVTDVSKKSSVSQQSNFLNSSSDDVTSNFQKSRSESPRKLNQNESTIQRDKNFSEIELNNVRSRLQQRLNELEPLPELLKNTELKLHDAVAKLKQYENEVAENRKYIHDLKSKLESAYTKLKNRGADKNELQELQKHILLNNSLTNLQQQQQIELNAKQKKEIEALTMNKMEPIERRIHNLEEENRELIRQLGHKDDLIRDITNKLSIKSNEASSFSRQLDLALSDSQLRDHQIKEKFNVKERQLMSRLNELESKLRSTELHSSVDRRDKDEMCQEYLSQIKDLKSKLEQTQQTNKQMQEYVNFLKNSYITYFNDSTLHSFDCTTSGSAHFISGTSSNTLF